MWVNRAIHAKVQDLPPHGRVLCLGSFDWLGVTQLLHTVIARFPGYHMRVACEVVRFLDYVYGARFS